MADRVLIVAAESSSALYARRLLQHWKSHRRTVAAFGVGDADMEAEGFQCLGRSEKMAVVGFKEVLRHYGDIKSVFQSLIQECEKSRPKFALLLDYPDFNLRLAKKLHRLNIPVVYYISPQLWAWRKGRISIIKKFIERVLVLFPFEAEFYRQHSVKCDFVGHPLLDELQAPEVYEKWREEKRLRMGLGLSDMVIGLMPGSRSSELDHHLETQLQVASRISKAHPATRFVLLVAPGLDMDSVKARIPNLDFPLALVQDEPTRMISMVDLVLTASGTATLVVGLLKKPMVVMYKMNSFSAWLARRFVKGVKHFAMVNLILGKEIVPERFQEEATPEHLSELLSRWIDNPEDRQKVASDLDGLQVALGEKGATHRVANALEPYF